MKSPKNDAPLKIQIRKHDDFQKINRKKKFCFFFFQKSTKLKRLPLSPQLGDCPLGDVGDDVDALRIVRARNVSPEEDTVSTITGQPSLQHSARSIEN